MKNKRLIQILLLTLSFGLLLTWGISYYLLNLSRELVFQEVTSRFETRTELLAQNLDNWITDKAVEWRTYTHNETLQHLLEKSNNEFDKLKTPANYINERDLEWRKYDPKDGESDIVNQVNNNLVSKNLSILKWEYEAEYGYPVYSEVFITNKYGANVAQSNLTTDYRQDDEDWWEEAKTKGLHLSSVIYDQSSASYALDLGVKVSDRQDKFLGVIKAVINAQDLAHKLNQSSYLYGEKVTLLNAQHQILFSSDNSKEFFEDGGLLLAGDTLKKNLKYRHYLNHDQVTDTEMFSVLNSFSNNPMLKKLGWLLIIQAPESLVLKPVSQIDQIILILKISLLTNIFILLLFLLFTIKKTLKSGSVKRLDSKALKRLQIFNLNKAGQ